MGTKSLTVFMDREQETVVMYRQMDGYLEGHGKDLADFLKGKKIINGIGTDDDAASAFNGMSCLAASVVAEFKNGIGGIYLYPAGTRECGEDYTYVISGKTGEQPTIAVEDFNGKASDYQAWLDNRDDEE